MAWILRQDSLEVDIATLIYSIFLLFDFEIIYFQLTFHGYAMF